MYLQDQSLGDWPAIVEVLTDIIECLSVVEQLSRIFRVSAGDGTSCQNVFGFLHCEACPLYAGGVMRLQQERSGTHGIDPLIRQASGLKKPAGTFDFGEGSSDRFRDGEAGEKIIAPGNPATRTFAC